MRFLDARGLSCPLPLLKLKQQLKQMVDGESITLLASDSGTLQDIPAFIRQTNHELIEQSEQGEAFSFIIKK